MAVPVARPPLEPIRSPYRVQFLADDQLDQLQAATLRILEEVGVKFPSEMALEILADHGAKVDMASQVVRFPPDLVRRALSTAPRYFTMGARAPEYDLHLADGVTWFTTDGCGIETIDFDTRVQRPSRKSDVAEMARVADYLPSVGFYWPMVSAQDHGRTAPAARGRRGVQQHGQARPVRDGDGRRPGPLRHRDGDRHRRQPRGAPPAATVLGPHLHHRAARPGRRRDRSLRWCWPRPASPSGSWRCPPWARRRRRPWPGPSRWATPRSSAGRSSSSSPTRALRSSTRSCRPGPIRGAATT